MKQILLIIILTLPSFNTLAQKTLVLARAPQLSPELISKTWTPFVEYLSENTGLPIKLKVYFTREEFESDLKKGKVDLYYGNPGYGVIGHVKHGYIPLIRSDRKLLEGIIVVRADSKIKSIAELEGKIISFPSKNAFAASLYIRSLLEDNNSLTFTPKYSGSHDNTYRSVLVGSSVAGGGVKRTLEREHDRLKKQLKIIYTTPGIKSHPLMILPRINESDRQKIQSAILSLDNSEPGKAMLKEIKLQNPVPANYAKDYKPIEKLAKKMYPDLLK